VSRFDRILRRTDRGAEGMDASQHDPGAGATAVPAAAASHDADAATADVAATSSAPATGGGEPATASADPEERPLTRRRSRVRRRLRHLQRARELLLRDLGGLVYELHRTPSAPQGAARDELVARKVQRLERADEEIARLGDVLGAHGDVLVVRQPGVGGTCAACGELFASDARFCSQCGERVDRTDASARAAESRVAGEATVADEPSEEQADTRERRVAVNAGDAR
jgi:hypothetical protein